MNTNLGPFDGIVRTLIFITTICYGILSGHYLWMIPGAILFATAVLTWCPIYAILGLNNHKTSEHAH
jgi:hypothetical protein